MERPTLVSFHAHPDDEAIFTGGIIARASDAGWRVVIVVATDGGQGEVPSWLSRRGETLAQRREAETLESARILGAHRVEFMGYRDSGMPGSLDNRARGAFSSAPAAGAARRLAEILVQEDALALTTYDRNGVYRHPDHVQVHRVGRLAAALAGVREVYQSTFDSTHLRRLRHQLVMSGRLHREAVDDGYLSRLGVPGWRATGIDVANVVDRKLAAMAAHASQVPEAASFAGLPPGYFHRTLTREWYVTNGGGRLEDVLLAPQPGHAHQPLAG